jgi:hypothetical protein
VRLAVMTMSWISSSDNRDAWGRKLKPFREVEVARVRYLNLAEAQRDNSHRAHAPNQRRH